MVEVKRYSQTLRAEFPGVSLDPFGVIDASLVQETMSHDILKLRLTGNQSYSALSHGAPVVFRWQTLRGRGVWYGYAHRVDPVFRKQGSEVEILCVGVSYPLMSSGVDTWVDVRAGDVVKDIARKFRLAADVENHPQVFAQISQAGESYWSLLKRLANQLGYVLKMDGAAIVFRSRESLARNWRSRALPLNYAKSPAMGTEVLSFNPRVGAFNPQDGAYLYASASNVDAVSGTIIHSSSGIRRQGAFPANHAHPTQHVARNAMEARTATSAVRSTRRRPYKARLTSVGDPRIGVERYVSVHGADAPQLWLVQKVEHEFAEKYTCISDLISDGSPLPPGETANPNIIDPHRPGALPANPLPVLVNHRDVVGAAGSVLGDVYWSAPVINWRN